MNCVSRKQLWLAGASLLAIVLASGDADALVFGVGEGGQYTIPLAGNYDFTVAGAFGGGLAGGAGAVVGGELFLNAGVILDIVVGGIGHEGTTMGVNGYAAGGGGGSFVFDGGLLFAAGGGGGQSFPGVLGRPGNGHGGYPAGYANYGGGGGGGIPDCPDPSGCPPAQSGAFPAAAQAQGRSDQREATVAVVVGAIMAEGAEAALPAARAATALRRAGTAAFRM